VTLDGVLIAYGSVLILPLAVIEGPVVSVVAGFLSARGYVVWYWALCLLVCGDLIGDVFCYWVGRTGSATLARFGRRMGAGRVVSPELQEDLRHNAARMLFIGKWTHSIGFLVLVGSGMLRLPLARFIVVNLIATLPKSAALLALGYFAAAAWPAFAAHSTVATIALGAVGVAAIALTLRRAGRIRTSR
jgi:membrane protein DedA with SNARE-associated domain